MTSRPESAVLDTTTGAGTLDDVVRVLDEFWSVHAEVPDHARMCMETAAGEIAANIVEHACRGDAVRMRMEIRRRPHEIVIEFTDHGVPAAVDLTAVRPPDAMAERGRGLALAQAMLQELSYRREGGVNRWTLISERFG